MAALATRIRHSCTITKSHPSVCLLSVNNTFCKSPHTVTRAESVQETTVEEDSAGVSILQMHHKYKMLPGLKFVQYASTSLLLQ